jgi:hypothetical protein
MDTSRSVEACRLHRDSYPSLNCLRLISDGTLKARDDLKPNQRGLAYMVRMKRFLLPIHRE